MSVKIICETLSYKHATLTIICKSLKLFFNSVTYFHISIFSRTPPPKQSSLIDAVMHEYAIIPCMHQSITLNIPTACRKSRKSPFVLKPWYKTLRIFKKLFELIHKSMKVHMNEDVMLFSSGMEYTSMT